MCIRDRGKAGTVQYYTPSEIPEGKDKERFFRKLQETLRKCVKRDFLMLMDDFNATVQIKKQRMEEIIRQHRLSALNDNGEQLLDLCGMSNLAIEGTIFPIDNFVKCHESLRVVKSREFKFITSYWSEKPN